MDILRSPIIVLDTETTGLTADPDAAPWEIGAVYVNTLGLEQSSFSAVMRPTVLDASMAEALAVGGVTLAEVEAFPPAAQAARSFLEWFDSCATAYGPPRVTAFNVAFDCPMLERMDIEFDAWAPCIMEAAKRAMGRAKALPWWRGLNDWKMPKLSQAAKFYGVPQQEPAHRALADARTAACIMVAIQRRALAAKAAAKGAA
jgi:DNA polymerase III epsilon subunit-like protein